MENVYKLGMAEDAVEDMELFDLADDIIESERDYQIVMSGWWIHISELGVNLHKGIYCNYDEEEQVFLPDFAITIVCDAGVPLENAWLYWEQDGFVIALANYLYAINKMKQKMDIGTVENLICYICLPDEMSDKA